MTHTTAKSITPEYVDSIKDDVMFIESGVDDDSGQMYVVCRGPEYDEYQFFYQEDVEEYLK